MFTRRHWWVCHQTKQLHKGPDVHQYIWWFPVCPCGLPQNPSCYICQDITYVSIILCPLYPLSKYESFERHSTTGMRSDLDYINWAQFLTLVSTISPTHSSVFTSFSRRCERNPCPVDNKACSQAPNSFSYHYLAVVSNLSAPRVMFRVSALRPIGDTLRFSLLGGRQARRHFTVQRSDRVTGQLMLVSSVQGPATLEAEVEMSELERRVQLGRYITKVTMFVSQYEF